MTTLIEARERRTEIAQRLKAIADAADARGGWIEGDDLTAANRLRDEFKAASKDVERLEAIEATSAALAAAKGNQPTDSVAPLAKAIVAAMRAKALNPGGAPLTVPFSLGLFGQPAAGPSLLTLPAQQTLAGTDSFKYLRQALRGKNNVHAVAKGAAKPEQPVGLGPVEDRVRTYPAVSEPIAEQDLADLAGLDSWLTQQLAVFVRERIERDIVLGDDDSPTPADSDEFTGIAETEGVRALADADAWFDQVRLTLAQFETVGITNVAVAMNPLDYAALELQRDNEGRFVFGDPKTAGPRTLFGRGVVTSAGVPQGSIALGDWQQATRLVTREMVKVTVGLVGDDFVRNQVRFRLETRVGFGVTMPSALAYGALSS